jgi:uncharacterized protein (DUF736 family)
MISIFKNTKKVEGSKQPDYRITFKNGDKFVDGGALWVKQDKNGNNYLAGEFDTEKQPYKKEEKIDGVPF